jgi:hypothetical protein
MNREISTIRHRIVTLRRRTAGLRAAGRRWPHNGAMASFLPSPRAVVQLSRYAVVQVMESAAAAATVPVRMMGLLSQAELAASRISLVAERAEALIDRVGSVVDDADETLRRTRVIVAAAALAVDEAAAVAGSAAGVVDGAGAVAARAAVVVDEAAVVSTSAEGLLRRAATTTAEAGDLLDGYAPTLRRAAPLAARFVDELTAEEVTAAIRMIDELPRLRHHLANDVMPLLGKLDQVGPDMHSLLEVTRDLHLAIAGIPGLRMLRRRGEQKLDEDDDAPQEQ